MSQEIFFSGAPNSDDDLRAIAQGWFRRAVHLRSGTIESANQYSRESYLGNALLVNATMPAGTNRVLGMCPNVESSAIMFFTFNSNNNHNIWLLNINSGTFTKVVQSSTLNFLITDYIYHAFVINGILYWTVGRLSSFISDNYSEPKQVDIGQAIQLTAGLPSSYTAFTRRTFDFVKWPPPFGPDVVYATDTSQEANHLYGKMYKFRYEYGYLNFEISATSPISRQPLPNNDEFTVGRDVANIQADNTLQVTLNTGPDIVTRINVLVSVNDGPWNICTQLNKSLDSIANNTTYVFTYRGNENLIPQGSVLRNYDNVPLVARCEAVLPTRQIAFGDYIEGFDKIAVSATMSAIPVELRDRTPYICQVNANFFAPGPPFETWLSVVTPDYSALNVMEGDVYVMYVYVDASFPDFQQVIYTITRDDYVAIQAAGDPELELVTILGDFVSITHGIAGAPSGSVYAWPPNINPVFVNQEVNYEPYRRTDPKVGLFKGIVHEFGRQYYDRANRDGTVLTSTTHKLYVPLDNEQLKTDFSDPDNPFYTYARMSIPFPVSNVNRPPDYATHWQVVWRPIPVLSFQERTGIRFETDANEAQMYKISLEYYYQRELHGNYNQVPKVGDTVRFIRQRASAAGNGPYVPVYTEAIVLKYDPTGGFNSTEAIWVAKFDFEPVIGNSTGINGYVIQIYTPAQLNENAVWKEIGEEFLVLNPNSSTRLHQGSTVTGTATNLATGLNTFELASWLVGPNGGNFDYLVGRTFNITADVPYTGVITAAVFNATTGITAITADTNFTGAQTFGSITIDLSQTTTLPCIVNIEFGNVYTVIRPMSVGLADAQYFTVDDFYYSGFYPSNFHSIGRPALEIAQARQIRQKATIEHGGAYVDNTEENNLCMFDASDLTAVQALDEQWGPINKMVVLDWTLKCIQDRKENSVYITNTFGAIPGGIQAGFNDSRTFAAWRQMKGNYGTLHPLSVQVAEGNLYYYDHLNGTIVRSSNNGQDNICEGKYKQKKRINEFKIAIDTFGLANAWVSAMVDEENSEYQITVFDVRAPTVGIQGHVFRYDLDKWDHEVAYAIFFGCNLGEYLVSVPALAATVWRHGTGAQNSFYGTIYTSQLYFPWNESPSLMKRPLRIGLRTNREWNLASFITEGDASYAAQDTEILIGMWELKEGYYWSSFLNDKNNVVASIPAIANATLALQNGRNIRAYGAIGLLTYTPSTGLKVVIFSVNILSKPSDPPI